MYDKCKQLMFFIVIRIQKKTKKKGGKKVKFFPALALFLFNVGSRVNNGTAYERFNEFSNLCIFMLNCCLRG
uniref:Uncharacterized protein n=1 Tax=Glossina morsitans morsitans TaxID=37546 RepID=A0ABK9NG10_GLOMM